MKPIYSRRRDFFHVEAQFLDFKLLCIKFEKICVIINTLGKASPNADPNCI
jgi:hypothetical protein